MKSLAVIGVGNMAKAIIAGIVSSTELSEPIEHIILFDTNREQYQTLPFFSHYTYAESLEQAVSLADAVLLSVKPQNYAEVLERIALVPNADKKLYISIGAGITVEQVTTALKNAPTVRVLPNVPMLIGMGVSVICRNDSVAAGDFAFVCDVFRSAGSIVLIDECEMNRMIGVTSSSPAYVFRFIQAIYDGAVAQGLAGDRELLNAVCDMLIGSATMLKQSQDTPQELIAKVASKGGTTERALDKLTELGFDGAIGQAMEACTARADELGAKR